MSMTMQSISTEQELDRTKLGASPSVPIGARILARDRRTAAVHEAGHLVIARMLRIRFSSAWIMPVDDASPPEESSWTGRVQLIRIPKRLGKFRRRMLGVAGRVAELSWRHERVDHDLWSWPEMMSESDWHIAECAPGEPDRACCLAILRVADLLKRDGQLWSSLVETSRVLIVESRSLGSH
jgi:hypothetical protein